MKCIEDEIPFELPEGWAWSRLSSISEIITKGASPKWQGVDYTTSGTLFVTSENVGTETLLLDSPKYLSDRINEIQPRSMLKKHDILTNIVGASIGRTCEYTLDVLANTNQAVAIVRLVDLCLVDFVIKCLNSAYCIELMFENQVNVARANLSLSSLANFLIPIPPFYEKQRIMEKISLMFVHIDIISVERAALDDTISKAKAKILDLAIRGQLVPPDPADEPASVLLERIRAEKEELIKQGKIKRDKKESIIFKGEDNSYYEKVGDKSENINVDIPFDLPEDWEFVRLKEIWELISGRDLSPSEYNADGIGIPYITGASNFSNGKVELVRWTASPQVLTEIGDLLLTCKGTIGEMAFNDFGAGHIARQIMAIRNIYDLNSKYLELCMEFYIQKIKESAKGLIPGISREDILNLILPIPPEQYQTQVVHQVEKINRILSSIEKSLS